MEQSTQFLRAYLSGLLFSETDMETGEPLHANFDLDDVPESVWDSSRRDCEWFLERLGDAGESIALADIDRAGVDLALTRNGHGAGFWDGDWLEPFGSIATDLARDLGEHHLDIGDDGALYESQRDSETLFDPVTGYGYAPCEDCGRHSRRCIACGGISCPPCDCWKRA